MKRERRKGLTHHKARLTTADVRRIRELRESGYAYSAIAIAVGCSKWTARDIADYRTRISE